MLRLFRVKEHSLAPEYQEGDFVLITKIPFFAAQYQPGDVVVFDHPPYGRMIKQVQQAFLENRTLFVIGTHPDSLDSRHFGPIRVDEILGKVIWHIKKPPSP
jgi:signal peptidase I